MVNNNYTDCNKRIAKNTLLLYIRSFIVMLIMLYTSRVVLKALGIEDYGLYNVIGGVVSLFAFLRTSLTKSTQRFLNTEMVKQGGRLNDTFCTSLNIHIVIAIIALLLTETIGLWFLNYYIQIPEGREFAANVVYQSTIFSLIVTIISVPYNAEIIAHEDMGYFAIVTIVEAVLKLIITFCLFVDSDRLILYGYLMAGVSVVDLIMYVLYSKQKYSECRLHLMFDRQLTKEMLGYTSWTVVGQAAIVGTNQGNNILVNIFHSVTANAAMGVASQVNSAIVSLTANFQTAFNPQITKSYAAKQFDYLKSLVFSTCKLSYILLTFVSLPIMFNIDRILTLWLDKVPSYCNVFCILIIWNSILNAVSAPFNFCVLSSGKIRNFQIATSMVYLSDLVIVYAFFCMGLPAYTALAVKVGIMMVLLFVRVYYSHREVSCIDFKSFIKEVFIPLFIATLISATIGIIMFNYVDTLIKSFISTVVFAFLSFYVFYVVGLTKRERSQVTYMLKKVKSRF